VKVKIMIMKFKRTLINITMEANNKPRDYKKISQIKAIKFPLFKLSYYIYR